jgi:hypothetical protein
MAECVAHAIDHGFTFADRPRAVIAAAEPG